MQVVHTCLALRYWSEILCCTIRIHKCDLESQTQKNKKICLSFWLKFLEAKHDSGKLRCLATARIFVRNWGPFNPLETPPHYILEDPNFDFRYIWLCDLDIPKEKWLNYLQTAETLIIRCRMQHLISICTVCQLAF